MDSGRRNTTARPGWPVPDIHHDDGRPRGRIRWRHSCSLGPMLFSAQPQQADLGTPPKKSARSFRPRSTGSAAAAPGSQDRPRPSSLRAASTAPPRFERNLDREDHGEKNRFAATIMRKNRSGESCRRIEQFLTQADAVPRELVVSKGISIEEFHHRHQRQDGRERHHAGNTGSTRNRPSG